MRIVKKYEDFQEPVEYVAPMESEKRTEEPVSEYTNDSEEYGYDGLEEEEEYIGSELMRDLAIELDTEIVDNSITHDGEVVNFFSEDEKFHIGNKKFKTVSAVIDYFVKKNAGRSEDPVENELENELVPESFITKRFNNFR